jgi:hypothetical protein
MEMGGGRHKAGHKVDETHPTSSGPLTLPSFFR